MDFPGSKYNRLIFYFNKHFKQGRKVRLKPLDKPHHELFAGKFLCCKRYAYRRDKYLK